MTKYIIINNLFKCKLIKCCNKKTYGGEMDYKQDPSICLQETHFQLKHIETEREGMKNIFGTNRIETKRKLEQRYLYQTKQIKNVKTDKVKHYIIRKKSIQKEDR